MTRFRRLLLLAVMLLLTSSFSSPAEACWLCQFSPNHWGFCRTGYLRGHSGCTDYVADPWSGRTSCKIDDLEWGACGAGIGDCLGCEPTVIISNMPCSWTDRTASSLL